LADLIAAVDVLLMLMLVEQAMHDFVNKGQA
jgi:hypothetical protein